MGIFFGVANISNIFGGCLNFLIFFGWRVDAGSEPTYAEKLRVSPPPPLGPGTATKARLDGGEELNTLANLCFTFFYIS